MIHVPDIDALDVRVLMTGIDTLAFTAPLTVSERLAHELETSRLNVERGGVVTMDLAGDAYTLAKRGANGGYRWLLTSTYGNIALTDSETLRGVAAVKGELGAFSLWHQGAELAYRRLRAAICQLLGVGDGWPAHVARVDLAVDFQGFSFGAFDAARALGMFSVVTRAHKSGPHDESISKCPNPKCGGAIESGQSFCGHCSVERGAKLKEWPEPRWTEEQPKTEPYYTHQRCTGWDWGKGGDLWMRLYNKTEKIRKTATTAWFKTLYEKCPGYNPKEPVARLEIQARRAFLKTVELNTLDGPIRLDTVEDVQAHAAALWRYVVGADGRECRSCGAMKLQRYHRDRYCHACRDSILGALVAQSSALDTIPDPAALRRALRDDVNAELRALFPDAKTRRQYRKALLLAAEFRPRHELEASARTHYNAEFRRELHRAVASTLREMFPDAKDRREFMRKLLKPAELRRPRGWLEIREPREDSNPSRWPIIRFWRQLQATEFRFSGAPAERARRVRDAAALEVALSQAVGNASSVASAAQVYERLRAELGRAPDAEEVWRGTVEVMARERPPDEFIMSVLQKNARRGAAPAPPTDTARVVAEAQFTPDERSIEWSQTKRKRRKIPRPPVTLEASYRLARTEQERWRLRGEMHRREVDARSDARTDERGPFPLKPSK